MAWTSNGFFRNISILKSFTATSSDQITAIYQPGSLNAASVAEGYKYSGFITTLRAHIDITSIIESTFPVREPAMSDGEFNAALRAVDATTEKKFLDILIKTSDWTEYTRIGTLPLYNRRPYYTADMLLYLTDATAFDCASDCVISMRVRSAGFGLLAGSDVITIHGSAVEEAENSAPALNINIFGGGAGGGSSSGGVVTDSSGSPITNNAGDIVTQ